MTSLKILVIGSNNFSTSNFVSESLRCVTSYARRNLISYACPNAGHIPHGFRLHTTDFSFSGIDFCSPLAVLVLLLDRALHAVVMEFGAIE